MCQLEKTSDEITSQVLSRPSTLHEYINGLITCFSVRKVPSKWESPRESSLNTSPHHQQSQLKSPGRSRPELDRSYLSYSTPQTLEWVPGPDQIDTQKVGPPGEGRTKKVDILLLEVTGFLLYRLNVCDTDRVSFTGQWQSVRTSPTLPRPFESRTSHVSPNHYRETYKIKH